MNNIIDEEDLNNGSDDFMLNSEAEQTLNEFEEDLAWSTGLGIHYLSFIGPVRIYLARGEFEGDTSYKLHFAVGPEL